MHSQMYACEYIDIQTRTGESQTKGDHKLSGEKKGAQRHEVDRWGKGIFSSSLRVLEWTINTTLPWFLILNLSIPIKGIGSAYLSALQGCWEINQSMPAALKVHNAVLVAY